MQAKAARFNVSANQLPVSTASCPTRRCARRQKERSCPRNEPQSGECQIKRRQMYLYVDVIDACHLKCPTCVRGVRAFPNTATKMSLEMFDAIVRKAKDDGAYGVGLFSWTEPFLCR